MNKSEPIFKNISVQTEAGATKVQQVLNNCDGVSPDAVKEVLSLGYPCKLLEAQRGMLRNNVLLVSIDFSPVTR